MVWGILPLTSFFISAMFQIMFHDVPSHVPPCSIKWYNMFHKGEMMEQDQYVKVNIKESTRTKLKDQARTRGMTLADYIEWLGANVSAAPIADEADKLLEQLDNKYENPALDPLIADLAPGELPPCCQEIYDDPEHPVPTCPHWEKAWVNYYGRRVVHYRNVLTGASYFDYFKKYTEK